MALVGATHHGHTPTDSSGRNRLVIAQIPRIRIDEAETPARGSGLPPIHVAGAARLPRWHGGCQINT
jgi:hypothetical protein